MANTLVDWCELMNIELQYIQPGKPSQNAFVERFNGSYSKDVLDAYWFESLEQVRTLSEKWRIDYNHHRPHEALGNISPVMFAERERMLTVENAGAFPTLLSSPLDRKNYKEIVMKLNIVYKNENEWFIGHIQEYPDYESQGKTLDELKENLIEIYTDIQQGLVPNAEPFKVLEMAI